MRFIALAASLLVPAQAFALSCLEPTVEFSYASAAESSQSYVLGVGTLVFDQSLMPKSTVGVLRPELVTRVPATIKGKVFTGKGFDQEFETDIEMVVQCIQSWCPVVQSETEQLVFLQDTETALELAVDPCGGAAFADPTQEMLDQVLTCFTEGNCSNDSS